MARRGRIHYTTEKKLEFVRKHLQVLFERRRRYEEVVPGLIGRERDIAECDVLHLNESIKESERNINVLEKELGEEKARKSLDEKLGFDRKEIKEPEKQYWWRWF